MKHITKINLCELAYSFSKNIRSVERLVETSLVDAEGNIFFK
jgi:hypothetical protein